MTRLIDADALIPMMKYATTDSEIGVFPIKIGFNAITEVIYNAPTIEAEPVRHGKWIDGHCSICGCDVPAYINDWKWQKDMNARFCPMCGARMNAE